MKVKIVLLALFVLAFGDVPSYFSHDVGEDGKMHANLYGSNLSPKDEAKLVKDGQDCTTNDLSTSYDFSTIYVANANVYGVEGVLVKDTFMDILVYGHGLSADDELMLKHGGKCSDGFDSTVEAWWTSGSPTVYHSTRAIFNVYVGDLPGVTSAMVCYKHKSSAWDQVHIEGMPLFMDINNPFIHYWRAVEKFSAAGSTNVIDIQGIAFDPSDSIFIVSGNNCDATNALSTSFSTSLIDEFTTRMSILAPSIEGIYSICYHWTMRSYSSIVPGDFIVKEGGAREWKFSNGDGSLIESGGILEAGSAGYLRLFGAGMMPGHQLRIIPDYSDCATSTNDTYLYAISDDDTLGDGNEFDRMVLFDGMAVGTYQVCYENSINKYTVGENKIHIIGYAMGSATSFSVNDASSFFVNEPVTITVDGTFIHGSVRAVKDSSDCSNAVFLYAQAVGVTSIDSNETETFSYEATFWFPPEWAFSTVFFCFNNGWSDSPLPRIDHDDWVYIEARVDDISSPNKPVTGEFFKFQIQGHGLSSTDKWKLVPKEEDCSFDGVVGGVVTYEEGMFYGSMTTPDMGWYNVCYDHFGRDIWVLLDFLGPIPLMEKSLVGWTVSMPFAGGSPGALRVMGHGLSSMMMLRLVASKNVEFDHERGFTSMLNLINACENDSIALMYQKQIYGGEFDDEEREIFLYNPIVGALGDYLVCGSLDGTSWLPLPAFSGYDDYDDNDETIANSTAIALGEIPPIGEYYMRVYEYPKVIDAVLTAPFVAQYGGSFELNGNGFDTYGGGYVKLVYKNHFCENYSEDIIKQATLVNSNLATVSITTAYAGEFKLCWSPLHPDHSDFELHLWETVEHIKSTESGSDLVYAENFLYGSLLNHVSYDIKDMHPGKYLVCYKPFITGNWSQVEGVLMIEEEEHFDDHGSEDNYGSGSGSEAHYGSESGTDTDSDTAGTGGGIFQPKGKTCAFGTCTDCKPGKYSDYEGPDTWRFCKACGFGSYQDQPGQNHCVSCPDGQHTQHPGSFLPEHCLDM